MRLLFSPFIFVALTMHLLGATLLLFHFGTLDLFSLPNAGILRVEMEVFVIGTLLFSSREVLRGFGDRRAKFSLSLFAASAVYLTSSFLEADIFSLFVACLFLAWAVTILVRMKEDIVVAEALD